MFLIITQEGSEGRQIIFTPFLDVFAKSWIKGLSKDRMSSNGQTSVGLGGRGFLAPGSRAHPAAQLLQFPDLHFLSNLAACLGLHSSGRKLGDCCTVGINCFYFVAVTSQDLVFSVQCYKV